MLNEMGRTTLLNRLRSPEPKFPNDAQRLGHTTGRRWALLSADLITLRRLELLRDLSAAMAGKWNPADEGSLERAVFAVLFPQASDQRPEFWKSWGINKVAKVAARAEFVRGFVRGAIAVWDEVRDEMAPGRSRRQPAN